MNKCPYCDSNEGYYMTETVRRNLYFTFDGNPNYSSEDSTVYSGKRKRCMNCNKTLTEKRGQDEQRNIIQGEET